MNPIDHKILSQHHIIYKLYVENKHMPIDTTVYKNNKITCVQIDELIDKCKNILRKANI